MTLTRTFALLSACILAPVTVKAQVAPPPDHADSPALSVSPHSTTISFNQREYGPKTEKFNPETRVWTVRFSKDGKPPGQTEKELIFNFYGWNPATFPKQIAEAYIGRRDNVKILGKFQAPDDVTKLPAYFIVSETLYPGEPGGFVNISKITSVGSGAYAVTFSKTIDGNNPAEKGKAWFLGPEGQAIAKAIGQIGVDESWELHFADSHK